MTLSFTNAHGHSMSDPHVDRKSEQSFTAFYARIWASGSENQGLQAEMVLFAFHIPFFLMKGFNHRFHLEEERWCDYQPSISGPTPAQSCLGVGVWALWVPKGGLALVRTNLGGNWGDDCWKSCKIGHLPPVKGEKLLRG